MQFRGSIDRRTNTWHSLKKTVGQIYPALSTGYIEDLEGFLNHQQPEIQMGLKLYLLFTHWRYAPIPLQTIGR